MRSRGFIVMLVVMLGAAPALAGRTGGGGHGGGGHHGGGSRGGASRGGAHAHRGHSSSHLHRHASDCVETSSIVGYRRCSKFGDWSKATLVPPSTLELLTMTRSIRVAPISIGGTTELEGRDVRYAADRPTARTMNAIGVGLRGTVAIGAGFYLGAEGEIGAAMSSLPVRAMALDAEPLTAWQGYYGQAVGVLGIQHSLGDTRIAVELAGGVLATPVTARFADDPESGSTHTATLAAMARPTAEARVRIARWLSPWASAGTFAGADLFGRGYSAGLQLGVHLRAFDGGR